MSKGKPTDHLHNALAVQVQHRGCHVVRQAEHNRGVREGRARQAWQAPLVKCLTQRALHQHTTRKQTLRFNLQYELACNAVLQLRNVRSGVAIMPAAASHSIASIAI